MEKFYIFLDIDGVLWDWKWRKTQVESGKVQKGGIIKNFNPESVVALNLLMNKLNEKYDVELVISSCWRNNMKMLETVLKGNGVQIKKPLLKTKITNQNVGRSDEILDFVNTHNISNNFLIIDDENLENDKITHKNFIKTNFVSSSLSKTQVLDWLTNNLKLDEQNSANLQMQS